MAVAVAQGLEQAHPLPLPQRQQVRAGGPSAQNMPVRGLFGRACGLCKWGLGQATLGPGSLPYPRKWWGG